MKDKSGVVRADKANGIFFCPYCNIDLKKVDSEFSDQVLMCLQCGFYDNISLTLTDDQILESNRHTIKLSPLERVLADRPYELQDDTIGDLVFKPVTRGDNFKKSKIDQGVQRAIDKGILRNYDTRDPNNPYLKREKAKIPVSKDTTDSDHQKDLTTLRKKGYKILHEY